MSVNNDKVSFWKLLSDKKIVIPIIQRDYAQGREGKEFLRERFLGQLFDALKGAKPLVLDFVYGSVEGDTFYPLDGQQRLTTLWLLHWYLALRAGTLSEDKNVLEKFSYETRISSKTFCQKLCGITITQPYQPRQHGIAAFVRNRTWFYSAYEQDPTIQSMLRMLNGTDISDSNKMDITDGIEEYCIQAELTKEKAKELLDRLKGEDAPICFYLLNMEDKNMPLTDDLYIKMNARGKVLTDFENFKVDLLKYMKYKLSSGEYLIPENNMSDESFSLLLDTRWTDLFWHYRSTECHIDEIYMSFFNRFFLNWDIANTEESADKVISSNLYKAVSAAEIGKGSDYHYQSISIYEPALKAECIKALGKCLNRMCDLYKNAKDNKQEPQAIDALFMPYWEEFAENGESDKANKIYSFIPRYATDDNTNTPAPITLKQQVVFHAVCVYLTNCEKVETENLKDWMHFVWNMVGNSYLDSKQSIGAIRFFDKELNKLPKIENNEAPGWACDNIIDYLAGIDEGQIMKRDVFGRRQLLEEIAKAKQIKQNPDWKTQIHEAEKAAFFKGAIAFLFNNEKGETDWSNFDTKWETAQELFDKDGVKADKTVAAMQTLYSYCDDWGSQFWWNAKIFNGKASTWKDQILTKVDGDNKYVYAKPIHYLLLMGAKPSKERKGDRRLRLLSSSSLIKYLVEKNSQGLDMYIRNPHDALHYRGKSDGVMLSYQERDECLNELLKNNKIELLADRNKKIDIEEDEYGDKDVVFWGNLDINFVYHPESGNALHLQWYRGGSSAEYDFYLMNEDWTYKTRPTPHEDEKGDRKRFYFFNLHIDEPSGESLADQFCKQVETEFAEFIKNPAE